MAHFADVFGVVVLAHRDQDRMLKTPNADKPHPQREECRADDEPQHGEGNRLGCADRQRRHGFVGRHRCGTDVIFVVFFLDDVCGSAGVAPSSDGIERVVGNGSLSFQPQIQPSKVNNAPVIAHLSLISRSRRIGPLHMPAVDPQRDVEKQDRGNPTVKDADGVVDVIGDARRPGFGFRYCRCSRFFGITWVGCTRPVIVDGCGTLFLKRR